MDGSTAEESDVRRVWWFLLSLPLIFGVAVADWVNYPLSRQLRGFRFSLLIHEPPQHALTLLSFGVLTGLLVACAIYGIAARRAKITCAVGAAMIVVAYM